MILRSLHQASREISIGQALRLVAEMGPEILQSRSPELLCMKDPKTGEYWSLEDDRILLSLFGKLAKLSAGIIEAEQFKKMPRNIYPDLYDGKVNKNSRKQAVVFVCRQRGDLSHRIPRLDERNFWRKLEEAFPLS